LQVICTPFTVNGSRGTVEWFVNNVSIGTTDYDHSGAWRGPRFELTNGAAATNFHIDFMPPKYANVI
jgi:hypothetical protein